VNISGFKFRYFDLVTILYQAIIFVLIAFSHHRLADNLLYLFFNAGTIAVVVLIARIPDNAGKFPAGIRYLYNLAFIPLSYLQLRTVIPAVHGRDLDLLLINIDHAIFGVHPTVWLEKITTPLLTEYLQLCYCFYYFLPVGLGIAIYLKKRAAIPEVVTGLTICYYLSFLGYLLVPAIGPRFSLAGSQTVALTGFGLSEVLSKGLNKLEQLYRDCFPSGHTAVTFLVLLYTKKFFPGSFTPVAVIVFSLIFSTVYLRYHYAVDVLAGILLAVVSIWLAKRIILKENS